MSEVKEKKTKKTTTKKTKVNEEIKEPKVKKVVKEKEEKEVKPRTKNKIDTDKALLEEKDQIHYNALVKALKVITTIVKVCLMIIIPFIFIFMVLVPIFINKVDIESNIIKYEDMSFILKEDTISLKIGDEVRTFYLEKGDVDRISNFLSNNPKQKIIWLLEVSLVMLAAIIILLIYLLSYLEKILVSFKTEKTPFTDDNTNYILKMCKLLLAIGIINLLMTLIVSNSVRFDLVDVVEILGAYVIYFVFKYATKMQKIANTKMCD